MLTLLTALQLTFTEPIYTKPQPKPVVVQVAPPPAPVVPPPPSVNGAPLYNLYEWGNCTWYVANHKAIPNSWGHARTWLASAQSEGYTTSTIPKMGSVAWFEPGWSLGHVAIVEGVNSDGSILISEMNVKGLNVVDERTITTEGVRFIY